MRTRYVLLFVIVCDLLMLFGGVPLERETWNAMLHHSNDRQLLWMLLAANVALMGICICGFLATAVASTRGVRYAVKRFSKVYAPRTQAR